MNKALPYNHGNSDAEHSGKGPKQAFDVKALRVITSYSIHYTKLYEQYGSEMPLNQVGNISAPEARLLVIDPWDKTVIPVIEKAILSSNLGLNPNNDGKVIRLQIPDLTADRRKEYVKFVKTEAEAGKVAIRNRNNFV